MHAGHVRAANNVMMTAIEMTDRYERRVRELEAFGHRRSASAQERAAADYLVAQMQAMGLEPAKESFAGARSLAGRLLVHVLVAAAGAALLWTAPAFTIILGAAALVSLLAEQTTRVLLLTWPTVRFGSWNLSARIPAARPPRRRIVLCAHYDTQHSGLVWAINRRLMALAFRGPRLLKPPMLPVVLMFCGQIGVGATAIAIGHALVVSVLAALLLASYGVISALFVQWAIGRSVPGAADNASGVAALLELAEGWRRAPGADDVELIVLLPGCEESGMLGAAAWADRHRREIRAIPTIFLNIDGIGFGPPRFLGAEVPVAGLPIKTPQDIIAACRQVAAQQGLSDAGPHALTGPTDGIAFLARRIPGATIVGFRAGGVLPHYHTMQDTADNMDFAAARAGVDFAKALLTRFATT